MPAAETISQACQKEAADDVADTDNADKGGSVLNGKAHVAGGGHDMDVRDEGAQRGQEKHDIEKPEPSVAPYCGERMVGCVSQGRDRIVSAFADKQCRRHAKNREDAGKPKETSPPADEGKSLAAGKGQDQGAKANPGRRDARRLASFVDKPRLHCSNRRNI